MCLDTLDAKIKRGKGYGYKGFGRHSDGLRPLHKTLDGTSCYPEEEWFSDTNKETIRGWDGEYPTGFHIEATMKGAHNWFADTRRKVYYREVVASGKQSEDQVIVARQIWITKEEI